MARNMQPIAKRCKALNLSPAAMGYAKKTTTRKDGGNMRKKKSEYAMQLTEKQKVKFVYGIMEKQFHMYYEKASRMQGKTGDVIEVREKSRGSVKFKALLGEDAPVVNLPKWLTREKNTLQGKVVAMPAREDIDFPVEEHLIVELYSK